jgi:hypothetical protein
MFDSWEGQDFSSPPHLDLLWGPHTIYQTRTGVSSSHTETDHSPSINAEVKNAWSSASIPSHLYGVVPKHKEKFIFVYENTSK